MRIKIDPNATILSKYNRKRYKAEDILNSLEVEATRIEDVYFFLVRHEDNFASTLMVNARWVTPIN